MRGEGVPETDSETCGERGDRADPRAEPLLPARLSVRTSALSLSVILAARRRRQRLECLVPISVRIHPGAAPVPAAPPLLRPRHLRRCGSRSWIRASGISGPPPAPSTCR
ncbi:hypothetical protein chiPu_0026456 [Chiloscyllium punctatum]|uniref:Uncharacterized protein n=1 Tax=Chiloscyllium punctatum TaxID=137246 RepID=A0A401THZ9_CHIPU|nr:hypothetical protein [Chiloscyllium punctatum]